MRSHPRLDACALACILIGTPLQIVVVAKHYFIFVLLINAKTRSAASTWSEPVGLEDSLGPRIFFHGN
jgi:hypothetical protein